MLECPLYNSITEKFPSLFVNVVLKSLKSLSLSIGPSSLDIKVCECHLVPFLHALQLLPIIFTQQNLCYISRPTINETSTKTGLRNQTSLALLMFIISVGLVIFAHENIGPCICVPY